MTERELIKHYKDAWQGTYQTAEDYLDIDGNPHERTLAISHVERETFADDGGDPKPKPVIHFLAKAGSKPKLPMVACKETWQTIVGMVVPIRGPKVADWKGFRVTFSAEIYKKIEGEPQWSIRPVGSPDIPKDMTIMIKLRTKGGRKRKPFPRQVRRTGNGGPPTSRSATGPGGAP